MKEFYVESCFHEMVSLFLVFLFMNVIILGGTGFLATHENVKIVITFCWICGLIVGPKKQFFVFSPDGLETYFCEKPPHLVEAPIDAGWMTEMMKQPAKIYFRRVIPREFLSNLEFVYLNSHYGLLLLEFAGCAPWNGQALLPYLLRNRRNVKCVFASLNEILFCLDEIEAYLKE